jgi:hypothetical protein
VFAFASLLKRAPFDNNLKRVSKVLEFLYSEKELDLEKSKPSSFVARLRYVESLNALLLREELV